MKDFLLLIIIIYIIFKTIKKLFNRKRNILRAALVNKKITEEETMFNIGFFKGQPTEYVIKFVNGKAKKEGQGLSFFYWKPNTTIAAIPVVTTDANFIFNEITQTFQEVTVQGQLTYRINDAKKISLLLDFSINPATKKYSSDPLDKLARRIINAVQMAMRAEIQRCSLEDSLRKSEDLAKTVLAKVREDQMLNSIGVECLSIYFSSIKPTPELARALEAEYREAIQKKADQAIYSRRAAAVEQERKIKENELDSDITLEKSRKELVELKGNNTIKEAEYTSKALAMELAPYKETDPKLLLAMGMKSLGEKADKIGNLTITTELLATILSAKSNSGK
jgi:regulator of protease activity HflC (stomatin/prohibitin superfamily)